MFPSTTINISGFKYSDQQVILGYLAPLSVDIKSYFLVNLVCRHFKCFLGNSDCLLTHQLRLSLSQKESDFTGLLFDRAVALGLIRKLQIQYNHLLTITTTVWIKIQTEFVDL